MKAIFIMYGLFYAFGLSAQLPLGQVIDTVYCDENPDQSYTLYLPGHYDSARQWPVIFIFEPAARGLLAVNKFKQGAEELGYILLASNNSKNGSWDLSFEAADAMFLDAFANYNIDIERVYTSGFSGGSRVAAAAALTGKINGIIACGAGFASVEDYQLQNDSNVFYAALVGNQDMNYQEHRQLEDRLNNQEVENTKIVFNASHQWPFSKHLKEALYWMELQCYKSGKTTSKNFSIDKTYSIIKLRADSTLASGDYVMAHEILKSLSIDFEGLANLKEIKNKLYQIEEEKKFKRQTKSNQRINELEIAYRDELGQAFTELYFTNLNVSGDDGMKDMNWWQKKIDYFKKLTKKENFQTRHMALRLLNLIWARSAESSFNHIINKDYETALVLNKVWLYAEPNTWGKWNMAKILAYKEDIAMYSYLQEVVNEWSSLTQETIRKEEAFQPFLASRQMKLIFSQLK